MGQSREEMVGQTEYDLLDNLGHLLDSHISWRVTDAG